MMKNPKRMVFFACVAVGFLALVSVAQPNSVDLTFKAAPSAPIPAINSIQQLVQPDGKVVVWGASLVGDGIAKGEIMRLNADGSLDNTFSYCGCGLNAVSNVALLSDGRFIAAGNGPNAKMIRLNADGSIDPSFVSGTPPNPSGSSLFTIAAIQPDGKILAYRRQSNFGFVEFVLYRFNQNGSVDNSFTAIGLTAGSPSFATVNGLIFLPDGRFYMAFTFGVFGSSGSLRRYNADGSVDSTWENPSFSGTGFPTTVSISGISLEADGDILVAGRWDTVNGLAMPHLIRLKPAGNVDLTFSASLTFNATGVEALSDGKVLYSQLVDISGIYKLLRLNPDGSADNTFTMDASIDSVANRWVRDVSGNIVFLGQVGQNRQFVRLSPDGQAETGFAPDVTVFGTIREMVRQPDGKYVVAGAFTRMNGAARAGIARLDADGNPDPTFDPGSGFNSPPETLVIQSDGKILAIGGFSSYNGTARSLIARINPDGTLDTGFSVTASSSVYGLTLQADGKILISGSFLTVNGTDRTRVARLDANGVLDDTFNPVVGSGTVFRTLVEPDGKIVIGGGFSGVNGFNRSNLVRLNSDGSLDQTFTGGSPTVGGLWRQADGKFLTAGTSGSGSLVRRNSDGSTDTTFSAPVFAASSSSDTQIHSVLVRPDGGLIVGGRFETVGGIIMQNIARLKADGAFNPLFLPVGADARVRSIIAGGNDQVLAGGDFTKINLTSQPGISRLLVASLLGPTPFDFDGDGRSDIAIFRPSENKWYILRSSDFGLTETVFAISGDLITPADYDGDGITDIAIFRPANAAWWYLSSLTGVQTFSQLGQNMDLPLPSDFDGDGRADDIVFNPATSNWTRWGSSVGSSPTLNFGISGDKPVTGDFNGDGKSDLAVYRPSTGDWWWRSSADGVFRATHWGISTDVPVPADYDGDGKTDFAVYRPSTGVWYILNSSTGGATIAPFGISEDKPVAADYDGDGKADIAVYRPSTGVWYILRTTEGFWAVRWGVSTDIPIPNAFIR
ncbi:MAG: FG-GAP-like repeat-containing protein [Pyrinomonadaceae bacterium]